MTSFSSLSEHCTNDLLCFHPTQRRAELRQPETTRNKEEGQGLPVPTTQQEWLWFSAPCSAESPRNCYDETNCQHSHWKTSENFGADHFPGFYLSRLRFPESCLPPQLQQSCSSHWCPETQDPHRLPAPIFWAGHVKKPHPRPLQLLRCLYYISGKQ